MNDPVWLGNHIIPRWEAVSLLGLSVVVSVVIGVAVLIAAGYGIKFVWKWFRF